MDELLEFLNGRIDELTIARDNYDVEGDYSMVDYCAGAIDAYDIIRIKLEDTNA